MGNLWRLAAVWLLGAGLAACVSASAQMAPTPSPVGVASLTPSPVLVPSSAPTRLRPSETVAPLPTITPSPVVASTATPLPLPSSTAAPVLRLLFTGDINPGRCPAQAALAADDFTLPYQLVADRLRAADITIGSLDGALSDLATPAPCSPTMNLIGPARTVEGLQFAGFDVLTVATNHALDCGSLGWRCHGRVLQDMRQILLGAGLPPAGIGATLAEARAPVILERQGVRFAFLGVNAISGEATWATDTQPGTAPLSAASLAEVVADVGRARAQADVVIVLPHWGVEYASLPDEDQRAWAAALIAAGADLVIGNHPHLAQPVETFGGGVAAYALGNFVFDQGPKETRQGVVFEAVFRGKTLESWQLLPVHIYALYQPRWVEGAEAEQILGGIADATRQMLAVK